MTKTELANKLSSSASTTDQEVASPSDGGPEQEEEEQEEEIRREKEKRDKKERKRQKLRKKGRARKRQKHLRKLKGPRPFPRPPCDYDASLLPSRHGSGGASPSSSSGSTAVVGEEESASGEREREDDSPDLLGVGGGGGGGASSGSRRSVENDGDDEEERLAAEAEAERLEEERLAIEAKEEEERLAAEEEARRLEEERLAIEAKEEEERLAVKAEAERLEEEARIKARQLEEEAATKAAEEASFAEKTRLAEEAERARILEDRTEAMTTGSKEEAVDENDQDHLTDTTISDEQLGDTDTDVIAEEAVEGDDVAPSAEGLSASSIQNMSYKALQKECKLRHLTANGKLGVLKKNLLDYIKNLPDSSTSSPGATSSLKRSSDDITKDDAMTSGGSRRKNGGGGGGGGKAAKRAASASASAAAVSAAAAAAARVTPSPKPAASLRDGPSGETAAAAEPLLPRDGDAEPDNGQGRPKWAPSCNPWGPIGHTEDDFVLVSPNAGLGSSGSCRPNSDIARVSQAEGGGGGGGGGPPPPRRFEAEPFGINSLYLHTHHPPTAAVGGGESSYRVLRLTRDRMALRPWGFSVRWHEFGGACLVSGVEPMSSAEAANDVGGPVPNVSSSGGAHTGLRLHDMLICANSKIIGGMTEHDLAVEIEACRQELILVVSQCRGQRQEQRSQADDEERRTWSAVDGASLDWNEIGPTFSPAHLFF